MNRFAPTRRRFVRWGAVGLTTGIAGCNTGPTPKDNPGDGKIDNDDNDATPPTSEDPYETPEIPDTPPATFQAEHRTYTFYDLPTHQEHPTDLTKLRSGVIHPDNRLFSIEILDASTARATIENSNVTRDIDLSLHVRDVDGQFQSASHTLTATETDSHETRTVEFDLSHVSLPTNGIGGICTLTGIDTFDGNDIPFRFRYHQFIGVPHTNGTTWVNSQHLTPKQYIEADGSPYYDVRPRGVKRNGEWHATDEDPAGWVEHIDTDTERIVVLVTRSPINGELFGVSTHIDHEPAQAYKNGTDRYKWRYGTSYEGTYATEISHLRELAEKTHTVFTNLGITSTRQRLEALGDFIQMIPYIRQGRDPPPTVVLYDSKGDCSSKSILMAAILQNDPWNMMTAYIDCEIDGIGHWTVGIDVNDLSPDFSGFTVSPTQKQVKHHGYPDTEYAFFDMTYDSSIGERRPGVENLNIYDTADYSHRTTRHADNPPNY